MITERTLRNWRADALQRKAHLGSMDPDSLNTIVNERMELCDRVLRLTMELMDIRLMERIRGNKK